MRRWFVGDDDSDVDGDSVDGDSVVDNDSVVDGVSADDKSVDSDGVDSDSVDDDDNDGNSPPQARTAGCCAAGTARWVQSVASVRAASASASSSGIWNESSRCRWPGRDNAAVDSCSSRLPLRRCCCLGGDEDKSCKDATGSGSCFFF